jgi:hypothetical protein
MARRDDAVRSDRAGDRSTGTRADLCQPGDFVAKKNRLGADNWGSDGNGIIEVTKPFQDMIAREFPGFDPYSWGRFDWVRTLILNLTVAQPLAYEYAELFRGLDDNELIALADSFALRNCDVRTTLVEQLRAG